MMRTPPRWSTRGAVVPRALGVAAALCALPLALGISPASAQPRDCTHVLPKYGQWRVANGYAAHTVKAEAIKAARADAERNLVARVRDSLTEGELAELRAGINTTFNPPFYDARTGQACVVAMVQKKAFGGELRKLSDALDAAIEGAVKTLRATAGAKARIGVEAPVWGNGADAGELGHALSLRLRSALGEQARRVTHRLRVELGSDGAECRAELWLADAKGTARRLDRVRFNPRAVGLRACHSGVQTMYLGDAALGLEAGQRRGADGLTVQLTSDLGNTPHCGGQTYGLTLRTNRPAKVRLYSVASDGRVMLGWPERVVDGVWRIDDVTSVRLGDGLSYRLVAVAVPAGAGFGPVTPAAAPGQPGACMSRGGLAQDRLPAVAALDTTSNGVLPPGAPGCPADPEAAARHAAVLAAVQALPDCR